VLLVSCLYLVQTCLTGDSPAGVVHATVSGGFGSAQERDPDSRIACGERGFASDAIRSRALDDDPFLAFLVLTAALPHAPRAGLAAALRDVPRLALGSARRPGTFSPQLCPCASRLLC
jgi:hypothetical protein